MEQLQRRYSTDEDVNPCEEPKMYTETKPSAPVPLPVVPDPVISQPIPITRRRNYRLPDGDEYGAHNPRRSRRNKQT